MLFLLVNCKLDNRLCNLRLNCKSYNKSNTKSKRQQSFEDILFFSFHPKYMLLMLVTSYHSDSKNDLRIILKTPRYLELCRFCCQGMKCHQPASLTTVSCVTVLSAVVTSVFSFSLSALFGVDALHIKCYTYVIIISNNVTP